MSNTVNTKRNIWLFILLIVSFIYALPNLYGEDPSVQIQYKKEVNYSEKLIHIEHHLKEHHIQYTKSENQENQLLFRFQDGETQLTARDYIKHLLGNEASVALNLAPKTPYWLQAIGAKPMKLGLDLRGGVHFLLDVDINTVLKARKQGDLKSIAETLRKERIRYKSIKPSLHQTLTMRFKNKDLRDKATEALKNYQGQYTFYKDEDGEDALLKAELHEAYNSQIVNTLMEQTLTTLNNRINELGVSEAIIQRQGEHMVSVDLPGIQDSAQAKEILGKTATLRFHLVDNEHNPEAPPLGYKTYTHESRPVLLEPTPVLTGDSITYAYGSLGEQGPTVSISLGGGGESLFYRKTADNVGRAMATLFIENERLPADPKTKKTGRRIQNERIINIATIRSALGNNFQITGISSLQEAQQLALLLRSGALAAPVDIVEELTVGPSLGKANISKGLFSLEIGFALVVVFMLVYYRLFGLFANLALAFNVLMIIAALSLIDATLTLPGIAGIVLTIGMAVDANVLINERIREEMRLGAPLRSSILAGYDKAFATIVDANITTLIVALILFGLGSGTIKGFAITLTIGLIASMISAIVFTRALAEYWYLSHTSKTKNLSIGV